MDRLIVYLKKSEKRLIILKQINNDPDFHYLMDIDGANEKLLLNFCNSVIFDI